ncbi:amino acid permease [Micromonospora marina]|uniref:amino acid permease n=1 Tax=Micromonospora marina TaxID=307120 RepID=UPI003456007A
MATTPAPTAEQPMDDDARRLAELGYKQELRRKWSGFSNFAISFSIISILAGCFTTFGQAWNNGGPVAISWGWPLISLFILIIGFCLAELVSAYPTAGGIYWWAAEMGRPVHGWFTGWLNLIGLVAVTASVDYGCATFLNLTLSALFDGWAGTGHQTFGLFVVILALHGLINIYGHRIIDVLQNVSVWWHVAGAAAVVLILVIIPIFLRLRMGDRFTPGPWTLGRRYKLLGWIAVVEIAVISVYFVLPIVPAGVPGNPDFSWTAVNYAPIAVGGVLLGVAVWWYASARKWFTGPRRTVDQPEPEPEPAEPS